MNQQNQGSGSSNPRKRKRGRPRKDESTAQPQADNTPVRHDSDIVINSNQTQGTTGDSGDGMLGRAVTGVIEGVFGAGYLLNVRVGDSQTYLKGAVFLPGRYAPVTPENDVAPHLEMIQRKQFPIPVLNQQPHMQSAIPSSAQVSQQPIEPKPPAPNMPNNDTSISAGGIPKELSEHGRISQSISIMSEMESEQDGTLHKLDTSRQVKDSSADGGAEKDSKPTPEDMNIDKEPLTGEQAGSAVLKLNKQIEDEPKNSKFQLNMAVSAEPEAMLSDQIHDEPKNSNVELNMAVSAEPEAVQSDQIHDEPENPNIELNQMPVLEPMQSEQTHDEPKNTDIELNQMPVSAEPKAMQSDLIHEEPENLNIEINQMPIAAEPESMQSEQIHDELKNSTVELNQVPISAQGAMQSVDMFVDQQDSPKPALETSHPSTLFEGEAVPSESKFASQGSNLQEMNAP